MPDDESPLISVKNLEKIYTGGVHAVKGVSFDVLPKQVVVIIGSSGSGKSTLVRCLTRLIEPDAGHVYVDQEDVIEYNRSDLTKFRRTKTAMVFQYFGLMPNRTCLLYTSPSPRDRG